MKILQDISFKEKFAVIISVSSIIGVAIVSVVAMILYTNKSQELYDDNREEIYVMVDNNVAKLVRSDDFKKPLEASLKGTIDLFHNYFWSLEPYKEYIDDNLNKAFDMGDNSVLNLRNVLNEKGFYNSIIAGKQSTRYKINLKDSIEIDYTTKPYKFKAYGKIRILKHNEIEVRNLITSGKLKGTGLSDNNYIGYDIINYKVINFDVIKTLDYNR